MSQTPKEPKTEYFTFGISKTPTGYQVVRTKMRGRQVIEVESLFGDIERIDAKVQLRVQVNKFLHSFDE